MLVEPLVVKPPVEALDVGILIWLAGFDEVQADAVRAGPRIQGPAHELRAVIRDQRRRLVAGLDESPQDLHHAAAPDRGVPCLVTDVERRRLWTPPANLSFCFLDKRA